MASYNIRRVAIEAGRQLVKPWLKWKQHSHYERGYSIILGVPWDLRHLLSVNLRFLAQTDLTNLIDIHIVFDRDELPGMAEIQAEMELRFDELPLRFHHYPKMHGLIVTKLDTANFYNASNCAVGLSHCRSTHAIIHDFDLYPVVPQYFESVYSTMRDQDLRFCGLEHTHIDGMTPDDNLIGTWCLGMDGRWLRENYRPIDIFHRIVKMDGKLVHLDPFSEIQLRTPERKLVGEIDGSACCHVRNLPSTYLLLIRGRQPSIIWRLHYLWYLEDLCDDGNRMPQIVQAMNQCEDGVLSVLGYTVAFNGVDRTCGNVLRTDLVRMDEALFGHVREITEQYLDGFNGFLQRFGS